MKTIHTLCKLLPLAIALSACGGGGGGGGVNPPSDNPAISLTKALTDQSNDPIIAGTTLEYTITATNTGDVTLTNVVVNDALLTPGSRTCGALAAGADCVLTGSYTVSAADAAAGEVTNRATVDTTETSRVRSNRVTLTVAYNPGLSVNKSLTGQSSNPAVAGTVLTYTVIATNTGDVELTNVSVADSMLTPANQTCATLAVGEDCVLTGIYTVTAGDAAAGQVQNTATADADETGSVSSNEVAVAIDTPAVDPRLSVSKALTDQSSAPVFENTVLEYTVTATNIGDIALTNVVVNDPLIAPASRTCATLATGAVCVLTGNYTVDAADVAAGQVQNTASVNATETGSISSNTVTVNVDAPVADPELSINKVLSGQSTSPVVAGTVLDYTVTATNTGNIVLTNVVINDALTTPDNENCATLAVGADCVLTGSYTVTTADAVAGEVANTASAVADETSSVNSNAVTVTVAYDPQLTVTKALTGQSDTPAIEGTVLDYTVTATNSGNVELTNVVVSDALITPGNQNCPTLAVGADCVLTGSYTVSAGDVTAGEVANTAAADADEITSVSSNTVTVAVPTVVTTGLDVRPSNISCLAPERPTSAAGYELQRVFDGIGILPQVLWLGQPPDDDTRWFAALRLGRILSFANDPGASATTTVLDIPIPSPPDEGGLLGFAFAPDFATSGEAYASYTRNVNSGGVAIQSVISRFTSADGGLTLNPASEEEILVINHPFANHNGGGIAFGPDGYLYLGMGDGGSISDPQGNGQNTNNLLGTFIRIDVSGGGTGYSIPPDNPFATNPVCTLGSGSEPCPEIFAWGLRNPFRWSFDSATGDLWAGDVGNLLREEVSLIQRGGNYGWVTKEGFVCLDPSDNRGILPSCDDAGLIDPVIDYISNASGDPGAEGASVIGGYVYRGDDLPELQGKYIFGDAYSGTIWTLNDDGNGTVSKTALVADSGLFIASFGEGNDGELYVVDLGGSGIYQLVEASSSGTNTIPDSLVDTGCVDQADPTQPASGLIPYTPGAQFWSDNAIKTRWLALPDSGQVGVSNEDFTFPEGSILVKNFERGGQLIETRLLMHHINGGGWAGYTYRWNDEQTAATRVVGGATLPAGGSDWVYPSEGNCLACHTAAAGRALGPEIAQLNNVINYPSTGRDANQLATLDHIMLLNPPLGDEPENLPALPDPFGAAPLDARARAYLHTNCAGCHRPGTPLQSTMDLRYDTPLSATNACNADSLTGGNLGIGDALLIAPGASERSLIPVRMNRRDATGMPPLGSLIPDAAGVTLIDTWIDSLTDCS